MKWFSRASLMIAIAATAKCVMLDVSKDMNVGRKLFLISWHLWSKVAFLWLGWLFVTKYLVVCATAGMMVQRYLEKIQDIRDKNNMTPDFANLAMEHLEMAERMDELWSPGRFGGVLLAWIVLLGASSIMSIGLDLGHGHPPVLFV